MSFYSKNLDEIKKVNKNFKDLFNIDGHIYIKERYYGKLYSLFFVSRELAIFLKSVGAICGKKTDQPLLVPSWIINGNKNSKRAYLIGIFSTEGYITKDKNNGRWRIGVDQYKNIKLKNNGIEYMEQLRSMLNEFNISSSPIRLCGMNRRMDGTTSIGLVFTIEKKDFNNFYKYVGFDNIEKQKKLIEAIK